LDDKNARNPGLIRSDADIRPIFRVDGGTSAVLASTRAHKSAQNSNTIPATTTQSLKIG
jgi:hypothetical protein